MTDISPWFQFGFPAALLVLILGALGWGARWFLKRYLDQQEKAFVARQEERTRREKVIDEQQEFIKGLVLQSMAEHKESIATQIKTAACLDSIVETLQGFKMEFSTHLVQETEMLGNLASGQNTMVAAIRDLEKSALVKHR